MIKFRAQGRKRVLFGFGITDRNIELLKEGHPIKIRMEDLGCKGLDVTIFYGPDDDTMKKLVEDQTGITLNPVKETSSEQRIRKSPFN